MPRIFQGGAKFFFRVPQIFKRGDKFFSGAACFFFLRQPPSFCGKKMKYLVKRRENDTLEEWNKKL